MSRLVFKPMIKLKKFDGLIALVILCDVCGKRINNATMAVVGEQSVRSGKKVMKVPFFIHKKKCLSAKERELNGIFPCWGLSDQLIYLLANAGISISKAQSLRKDLAEVGQLRP